MTSGVERAGFCVSDLVAVLHFLSPEDREALLPYLCVCTDAFYYTDTGILGN